MAKKENKSVFDDMPIDEWLAYIEKNGKDEDEKREMKVEARRSLTVLNMVKYNKKYDNTKEAKRAFKTAATYTAKNKDNEKTDDRLSVINAASYFVKKYIPELEVEAKKKARAFDIIKDW